MSFSIDMKDAGAAFEQGVQAPTATEYGAAAQGLQALSKGVFSIADTVARRQSTGPTQTSVDRASAAKFFTTLQEKTRGVEDLDQLSAVTNGLLTQFIATTGQKPDASMFDAIEAITGLDKTTITFNAETAGYNEVVALVDANPSFRFLSEQELKASGQNYNMQDVMNLTVEKIKLNEASMASLTLNRNVSEAEFQKRLPLFDERIDQLTQLAGAALEVERQGGNVDPEFLKSQLMSGVALLRANFARPTNVSADTYAPIENQIAGLEALVKNVANYDADQFEMLQGQELAALGRIIVENAKGINDPILAASIIEMKPEFISAYMSQKVSEGIDFYKNLPPREAIVYTEVKIPTSEVATIERKSETSIPDEGSIFDSDTLNHAAELEDRIYKNTIDYFINTQVNATTVEAMSVEAHRNSFLQGIGKATTYIHSRDSIRDMKFIRTLYSDETLDKLNAIKKIDPEGYTIAVARLKSSLFKQYVTRSLQQSGTLQNSPWAVSAATGEIAFIPQPEKYGGEEGIKMITQYANEYYNGDLTAMAKDGGARGREEAMADNYLMTPLLGELARAKGLFREAKTQLDINNFYKNQLKKLGMSNIGVDKTFNKETSEQNPYVPPKNVMEDLDFIDAVDNLAFEIGAIPQDLLRIMAFETGNTFNPAEKSKAGTSATGLIQFVEATAKDLGTSTAELAGMTRVEQLEYVSTFLKQKLKGVEDPDIGDLYMAVLYPKAVGKANDYILFSSGSNRYDKNMGLDMNQDGFITKGEAVEKMLFNTSGQDFTRREPEITQQELDESVRPQVRPDTEQQSLPIISQADFYNDDVKRYVESMNANPDTTVVVNGRREFERMREQGMFEKGQIVVVRLEDGDLETHRIN
tara:strand:- start:1461 stop:4076 length:2616 start_codon:yes stop_codon:yes gene_type:complete